jgi:hypothetical protein
MPLPARRRLFALIASAFREVIHWTRRAAGEWFIVSCVASVLLAAAGFGAFYMAWRGAAATLVVGVQIAYLLSGGFSGLALVATGIGIVYIQMSRRLAAREDLELNEVLDRALDVLAEVKKGAAASLSLGEEDTHRREPSSVVTTEPK